MWDTAHADIGKVLVREGLAALDNSCNTGTIPCTSEPVTASSDAQVAQINLSDLEAILNAYVDVQNCHETPSQDQSSSVTSIQQQPSEASLPGATGVGSQLLDTSLAGNSHDVSAIWISVYELINTPCKQPMRHFSRELRHQVHACCYYWKQTPWVTF